MGGVFFLDDLKKIMNHFVFCVVIDMSICFCRCIILPKLGRSLLRPFFQANMFNVACKDMNSFSEKNFILIRPNLNLKLSLMA